MHSDTGGIPDSLRLKFPELRPVKSPPTLVRINGIGSGMYGQRDFDEDTATYVKTHCICLVFLPIIALGAYRVADAEQGWYFIGKDRLSSFAKSCNFGVLLLSLMFAAIVAEHSYTTSPDYIARQALRQAEKSLKSGKSLEAARIYRDLALGTSAQVEPARLGMRESLEECLTNNSASQVEAACQLLATLPQRLNSPTPLVPDAYQRGLAAIEKFRTQNPDAAVDLLRQVEVLAWPTNGSLRPLEIDLLKGAIAAKPDNTNRVVELALIYEDQKQLNSSYELLSPYARKLAASEGARILGQHLLEEGHYADAYGLLYPYVQARLDKLHAIERNYTNAMAMCYKRSIADLNEGHGDRSFYDAYKTASKAEKVALVDDYIQKRLQSDPAIKRATAELSSANKIVHVSLDLGMVQLNRAQSLDDPAARKSELEAAEKTFLAVRGLAGDTDSYRLFLGQVYYWLGRSKEGSELFTKLLTAHQRAYPLLMRLAQTLREVGEQSQARELTEEAYRTAKSDKDRFNAADLRARLQKSIDDEIAWLERSDQNSDTIQIDLNSARGVKALHDGDRNAAAQYLRKAVDGYRNIPQSFAMLNNCGLACINLYYATGDITNHNRGLALLEQALALSPGDSVLLMNITDLLITRAFMDVVGDGIHFADLKETPDQSMLAHLYRDEQGRAALIQQLSQNEHMKKALSYLDKALLLAPKNSDLYALSLGLQETFRDFSQLQKLKQRIQVAAPDSTEMARNTREAYDPAKDKARLDRLQHEISRYQALIGSVAVRQHPLTLKFVQVVLNGLGQGAALWGANADSQTLLDQAIALHQSHPTSASLATLIGAHFARAHEQLKHQSTAYAALAERTRRAMSPRDLMALLLDGNDSLARLVRKDPNFLRALELIKEDGRLFPSFRQPDEWALFRTVDADEAALVAHQVKSDQAARLADELRLRLNPISSAAVLRQYWIAKINSDQPVAVALYQQASLDGVPLPAL